MVEDLAPAYRQVEELTEPVVASGRSHAGFNPASGADVKLFSAVLDGNHLVRGFRNADIREAMYESIDEAGERRRRSHAVGRMLKRLHVRGLIVKVPHSRRWLVSRREICAWDRYWSPRWFESYWATAKVMACPRW